MPPGEQHPDAVRRRPSDGRPRRAASPDAAPPASRCSDQPGVLGIDRAEVRASSRRCSLDRAIGVDHAHRRRRQLAACPGQNRARGRDDGVERSGSGASATRSMLRVDATPGAAGPADVEAKRSRLRGLGEVERLDAEAVPGRAPCGHFRARRWRRRTCPESGRRSLCPTRHMPCR